MKAVNVSCVFGIVGANLRHLQMKKKKKKAVVLLLSSSANRLLLFNTACSKQDSTSPVCGHYCSNVWPSDVRFESTCDAEAYSVA